MRSRSTALFDRSRDASRAIDLLDEAHFDFIRVDKESTEFASTLELTADDLVNLGVVGSEVGFYANQIQERAILLVVSCAPGQISELDNIMNRVGLKKFESNGEFRQIRYEERDLRTEEVLEEINESGFHRQHKIRKEYQRADSERMVGERNTNDASGLSRRAYTMSSEDIPLDTSDIPQGVELLPEPYARFENPCVIHYEEHFVDKEHTFREYLRAYHYGMMLAGHDKFRDRSWDEVENFARPGWDPQTHGRWEDFESAVRFGWDLVRHEGQDQRPRL